MKKKMEEINDPYVTSTVLKFITKSKNYLSGDGQIEGVIPDAEFSSSHEETNTGRELHKVLYSGAPHKKFMISYNYLIYLEFVQIGNTLYI